MTEHHVLPHFVNRYYRDVHPKQSRNTQHLTFGCRDCQCTGLTDRFLHDTLFHRKSPTPFDPVNVRKMCEILDVLFNTNSSTN